MKLKKALMCFATAAVLAFGGVFAACNPEETPPDDGGSENPPVVEQPEKTVTDTKLTVYEGPNLMESSSKLKAYVEDEELFVYESRVNHGRIHSWIQPDTTNPVVIFDFEGKVHMKVEITGVTNLTDVVVRPLSYGVETTVSGNIVEFDLEYSANYTLEYLDGTTGVTDAGDNALHIFANPIEEDPITAEDAAADNSIVYIGPGVYSAGAIPLQSNQTLYIAGGAYVYGQIRTESLENITIRGRGIICGEIYDRRSDAEYTLPIEIRFCNNVTIEGITILDPAGWTVTLYQSENIEINNLKLITARSNGDGISVQSSKNVTVTGGFMRTWDDTLVVKNSDRGVTANVTFDNVVVWTDLAQSMEVGYETNGATMDGITFKNITVLHNYHKAAMSIHNADDAAITNVTYQNITIEDASMLGDNQTDGQNDYLIDINIEYNADWSKANERGTINGVLFENIKVLEMADSIVCSIKGNSTQKDVKNVTIRGVEIEGVKADTAAKLKLTVGQYASGVTVSDVNYEISGANVKLPYILELANENVAKTVVPTLAQQGLEVPEFAILDVEETYMGVERDLSDLEVEVTHGNGNQLTTSHDDGSGPFDTEENPISNAFDGDRSTEFVAKEWRGGANEFAAITINMGEKLTQGSASIARIYLAEDSAYVYNFRVRVFAKANASDARFVNLIGTTTYSATPANGNYFDIKLETASQFNANEVLQFRFFRVDGMSGQPELRISEIKIFPASLSSFKQVETTTPFADVYDMGNLVDGSDSTYWETPADTVNGAYFTVDLGEIYNVKYFVMHLPPLLTWEPRDMEIEIQYSTDGTTWQTAVQSTKYHFDPATGNANSITLDTPVQARYIKLVWSSNSSSRYGAQLSELYVYGV